MTGSSVQTATESRMSWDDIGFICECMSFASRPIAAAGREITEKYSLGPRGVWIIRLISNGKVYPLDITNVFRVGRSLISAELARLTEAELITSVRSAGDGRRTRLALTPAGEAVCQQVTGELRRLVEDQLAKYSREEMLFCARMLRDFREAGGDVSDFD
jgi:DNA-binding MarR family transcriptional regulator